MPFFVTWAQEQLRSEIRRNALWYSGLIGFQRVVAVLQTILIARILGITEYGVYGLIFGTIGLIASTAALQMGLTATVFVARYKKNEQSKAAAVITFVNRFGWISAIFVIILTIPYSNEIANFLLQSSSYQVVIILGAIFIGSSIINGIQEGVAQGFELFSSVAKANAVAAIVVLAAMGPSAKYFGLIGVLVATLSGTFLRFAILKNSIRRGRLAYTIPKKGAGVQFHSLMSAFALPSMFVSLGTGGVTWFGMVMLSKQGSGFSDVAIVNAGLQWRSPVLLLLAAINAVAVPRFSQLHASGHAEESSALRHRLVVFSATISIIVGISVVAISEFILKLYGDDFKGGSLIFNLMVLSAIPTALSQVYMQQLVGSGKMWKQLVLHVPYFLFMMFCFFILVPTNQGIGYASTIISGAFLFLAITLAQESIESRRKGRNGI